MSGSFPDLPPFAVEIYPGKMDANVYFHTMRFLLVFILLPSLALAEVKIAFRDIPYSALFETARKEGKAVMIYFHFDGCGACIQMEKNAMADSSLAAWWNDNYVSFEVNTRTPEGREVNGVYQVEMHPTFLFLDSDGKELHKVVGIYSISDFLNQGKRAIESSRTLQSHHSLYRAGERSAQFLFEYSYMLRDAHELDPTVVNEYLSRLTSEDMNQEYNLRYVYEFCVHHYQVFTPFGSTAFNHLLNERTRYESLFEKDQVAVRIVWILHAAMHDAMEAQDKARFDQIADALRPFDSGKTYVYKEVDSRVTGMISSKHQIAGAYMMYYEKSEDRDAYLHARKHYLRLIRRDASGLNDFAWGTHERTSDPEKLKCALKCANRAVRLEPVHAHLDTQAWLLYDTGDYKGAIRAGYRAIEQAKKENQNYAETEKLVRMAQEKYGKDWRPTNCMCAYPAGKSAISTLACAS
jgi:thioredoxin-related protein